MTRFRSHCSTKRPRTPSLDENDEDNDIFNLATINEEEEEQVNEDFNTPTVGEEEEERVDVVQTTLASTRAAPHLGNLQIIPSSRSSQSVKLMSSDILDCPTCYEPLNSPIFQCSNWHLACLLCCTKLGKKCFFCGLDIGNIRCVIMEKIVVTTIVPCSNSIFGCQETTTYGNQSIHQNLCLFIRCSCPLPNCIYTGAYMDIKQHARIVHSEDLTTFVFDKPVDFSMNLRMQNMVIFQEEKEGDLIVVKAFMRSLGVYLTVSCIAPMNPEICNLACGLTNLDGDSKMIMTLKVKKIQKVEEGDEQPKDGFMLIPSYMFNYDFLKMRICIRSHNTQYISL